VFGNYDYELVGLGLVVLKKLEARVPAQLGAFVV
jgi:hypothetical protein